MAETVTVELLKGFLEAFNRHDLDSIMEYLLRLLCFLPSLLLLGCATGPGRSYSPLLSAAPLPPPEHESDVVSHLQQVGQRLANTGLGLPGTQHVVVVDVRTDSLGFRSTEITV